MATIGWYDLGTSTTLASNKSLVGMWKNPMSLCASPWPSCRRCPEKQGEAGRAGLQGMAHHRCRLQPIQEEAYGKRRTIEQGH